MKYLMEINMCNLVSFSVSGREHAPSQNTMLFTQLMLYDPSQPQPWYSVLSQYLPDTQNVSRNFLLRSVLTL
jgi:hypothetical protein